MEQSGTGEREPRFQAPPCQRLMTRRSISHPRGHTCTRARSCKRWTLTTAGVLEGGGVMSSVSLRGGCAHIHRHSGRVHQGTHTNARGSGGQHGVMNQCVESSNHCLERRRVGTHAESHTLSHASTCNRRTLTTGGELEGDGILSSLSLCGGWVLGFTL